VTGEVKIDRGYLQLFGKVFELTRESRLRFIGSNPPNPVLELEATHKSRGGSIVSVRITGRGDEPTLQFLIDGKEVDAGVAVQELFGGEKSSSDSDASDQARNFVSGLTAGVLATAARKELGAAAPIIMIDPAEKAGEGRVRAGFELDDIVPPFLRPVVTGAYLEGILARESEDASSGATTQFGALLELYFPRNLFTAGQYGPGTTWSVDFGWQL
jgi:translocation and assembly module TamB